MSEPILSQRLADSLAAACRALMDAWQLSRELGYVELAEQCRRLVMMLRDELELPEEE
jgi:hypothetical protein